MKPLDVFLRDYVRTLLKAKGFTKKGRDFRLIASNGDMAIINFHGRRLDYCEVEFILEVGVLSSSHVKWLAEMRGLEGESIASALWRTRLKSPFAYMDNQFLPTDTWVFNLNDDKKKSTFLGELGVLADRLTSLTDRRNLISMVRDPATEVQQLRASREHALAFLLVDEGPSRELEEILGILESKDPADDVVSWVRAKLTSSPG